MKGKKNSRKSIQTVKLVLNLFFLTTQFFYYKTKHTTPLKWYMSQVEIDGRPIGQYEN